MKAGAWLFGILDSVLLGNIILISEKRMMLFFAVHRDNNGVVWVDDSKATNVEATYTGLVGLKGQKSVVLLGGIAKVEKFLPSSSLIILLIARFFVIYICTISLAVAYHNLCHHAKQAISEKKI